MQRGHVGNGAGRGRPQSAAAGVNVDDDDAGEEGQEEEGGQEERGNAKDDAGNRHPRNPRTGAGAGADGVKTANNASEVLNDNITKK